jgi:hypothetical protein
VKAPEKTLDEAFWKLPRARWIEPPRRDLDDLDGAEEWELQEAV